MYKCKLYLFLLLSFLFTNSMLIKSAYAVEKSTTILVMGDSLSAAYGIELEQGWVNLLKTPLTKYPEWQIINASVSGETTSGGLARLPKLLSEHQPKIVIIELGGNDGLRGQPLKLMEKNLQAMIDASKNSGAAVMLVGMQIPPNYGQRYTHQFTATYQHLAEKNQLALVDFLLAGVATNSDYMQKDGIHPTAEAQPIIVQNVWPVLERMLAE